MAHGVGTTMVAMALSAYLARSQYRTMLVEAGAPASLALATGMRVEASGTWAPRLDVLVGTDWADVKAVARDRRHPYVVADLGVPGRHALPDDADLLVMVLPPSVIRFPRALAWLHVQRDALPPGVKLPEREAALRGDLALPAATRYAVVGASAADAAVIGSAWVEATGRCTNAPERVCAIPWPTQTPNSPPGHRAGTPDLDRALAQVLNSVLPDAPAKDHRRWPFGGAIRR